MTYNVFGGTLNLAQSVNDDDDDDWESVKKVVKVRA